ncbi:MAG: ferrous iron transport protein A [Oscillospiraceae bacterium]|nr:ferrous iron transport protein A [Oscillospiraceae bacterium]
MLTLRELAEGEAGIVRRIALQGAIRRRVLDLGLIEGTKVVCLRKAPSGDPVIYFFRGTMIALRRADCGSIFVEGE